MAVGQCGGLRAICVHALDDVLVLERQLCRHCPTVGTSFFASWKKYHMIFGSIFFVCAAFGERTNPHLEIFLSWGIPFWFEHHEVSNITNRRPLHWSCHSSPGLYRKAPLLSTAGGCSLPSTGSLMAVASLLLCAFALAIPSYGKPAALETRNSSGLLCTCNEIAAAISGASQVFFPRMSLSHV
jgi:hypothetical protein